MTTRRTLARLSSLIAVMMSAILAPVASASDESPESACLYPAGNKRFAFSVAGGENGGIGAFNVAPLNAGAYLDWGARVGAPRPSGMDYFPMIHVDEFRPDWQPEGYSPSGSWLRVVVNDNPGATWLIGNEAEYRWDHDHTTPEGYARIYHDVYHTIKGIDPTAKIAMNGIATVSPLRLAWLDSVWNAYRSLYGTDMPVDVWNFHGYVVNEMVYEWGPDLPYGFVNAVGFGKGEWQQVNDASASGGTYHKSRDWGARSYFAFEGDHVTLYLHTGPDAGLANIFVDAQLRQTIDLYTPEPGRRSLTFTNLQPSPDPARGRRHHVRVDVHGLTNPAASDRWVRVDAISAESTADLPGGRLEDNNPLRATIITHPDEYDDLNRVLGQVRMMRQWMADHGQRNKPLINTEYGILLDEATGFDSARVRRYLLNTFDLFWRSPQIIDHNIGMPDDGGRMIQQWFWFILSSENRYNNGTHTSLMSPVTLQMLPLGQEFGNYVRNLTSSYTDLVVAAFQVAPDWALFAGEQSTLRATGTVRNLGNRAAGSFGVRLASDATTVQQWQVPGLSPRHGGNDTFTVDHSWRSVITGQRTLTLIADSAGQVGEPCDPNNTASLVLTAPPVTDMTVTNLATTPAVITGNTTALRLAADVSNLGARGTAAGQVVVRFWDGQPGAGGVLLHSRTIQRGSNANLTTVNYDWQGFSRGRHIVVVEVAPVTEETNLANNRQQLEIFIPHGQNFAYVPAMVRSHGRAVDQDPDAATMLPDRSTFRLDLME